MKALALAGLALVACRRPMPVGITEIRGQVVLVAPVSGALVRATLFGIAQTHVLSEARTDENGNFSLTLDGASGVVVLDVIGQGGGVARDPWSDVGIVLSAQHHMATWVTGLALGEKRSGVIVSAWSTLVAARARFELAHAAPEAAWTHAAQLFTDHFAGNDVVDAVPLDPQAVAAGAPTPAMIHGFATTALALALANTLRLSGLPPEHAQFFDLLAELEADLSDGVFDGQPLANPLCPIDTEFTRTRLGSTLTDFTASATNLSGVGVAALVPVIAAVSTDQSALYPTPSGAQAEGDPQILVASPSAGGLYARDVDFIGMAKSAHGVASVELSVDGSPLAVTAVPLSASQFAWSGPAALPDGSHTLTVTASNALGTTNNYQETFVVDGTPPVLSGTGCAATDDTARAGISVQASGVQTWGSAPSANCSDFSQLALTLYRDRLGLTSLQASITDASSVTVSASLWLNGAQIGDDAPLVITDGAASDSLGDFLPLATTDAATLWELRLAATDAVGNASSLSAFVTLSVLATPPFVEDQSASIESAAQLASYSFASGNIAQLPIAVLPHCFLLARYRLTNVSQGQALLALGLNGVATGTLQRWRGLLAASEAAGNLLNSGNGTPPAAASGCSNAVSDPSFSQGSIPANPSLGVATPGQGYACITADKFPTVGIDKTTTSAFAVAFSDADSTAVLAPDSNGRVLIAGGERVMVDISVTPPAFTPDSATQCVPSFGRTTG